MLDGSDEWVADGDIALQSNRHGQVRGAHPPHVNQTEQH